MAFAGAESAPERDVGQRALRAHHEHDPRHPRARHRARRSEARRARCSTRPPARAPSRSSPRSAAPTSSGRISRPCSIDTARERAAEEGVDVQFEVGDAEAHDLRRCELRRRDLDVRRHVRARPRSRRGGARARHEPGGRIALACWTPEGGLAQMFGMMGPFLPPPPEGAGSPFALGQGGSCPRASRRHVRARVRGARLDARGRSGEEYWELFSSSYGPTKTAAESARRRRREEFHRTWVDFFEAAARGDEVVHHREYLLTLGTRRRSPEPSLADRRRRR